MYLILDVCECKEFNTAHSGVILVNEFKAVSYLTYNKNIKRLLVLTL